MNEMQAPKIGEFRIRYPLFSYQAGTRFGKTQLALYEDKGI